MRARHWPSFQRGYNPARRQRGEGPSVGSRSLSRRAGTGGASVGAPQEGRARESQPATARGRDKTVRPAAADQGWTVFGPAEELEEQPPASAVEAPAAPTELLSPAALQPESIELTEPAP